MRFDAYKHEYWLGDVQLKGITSTLIKRAFPNKYCGIPDAILAEAARKGHELHEQIQWHDRYNTEAENIRIANYDRLKAENGFKVVANEYLVSDEKHYASSIDMVATNADDEICLVDFKTTWNLDKESCALQLSIYKRFFEMQNKKLKVAHIFAIWLPNKDENVAECIELGVVNPQVIDALIEADLRGDDIKLPVDETPYWYPMLEEEYDKWNSLKTLAESKLNGLKEELMERMQQENITQIKSDLYTVSFIPSKKGMKFDSAAFKKEHKDIYEQYQKESETAASIRFLERKKE